MFSKAEGRFLRELAFPPFFSILPLRTTRDGIFANEDVVKKVLVVDGCRSVGDGWLSKSLDLVVQCEGLQLGSKDLRKMSMYKKRKRKKKKREEARGRRA